MPPTVPEIIAHRGASHDAPENTLAAWILGWEQGADAGELDIQLSQDGQVVVLHDSTTQRTAGLDKLLAAQTLSELRLLDAGSWKGPRWIGEKIPTLTEALSTIPMGKKMFIELKRGPEILPALEQVLKKSELLPEQLILMSFSYETMQLTKHRFPANPCYWLVPYKEDPRTHKIPTNEELIEHVRAAGLDGLNLDFRFPFDAAFVTKVKAAGLKIYTWTIDDPHVARQLQQAGVNGITTNRPAWLRQQLFGSV